MKGSELASRAGETVGSEGKQVRRGQAKTSGQGETRPNSCGSTTTIAGASNNKTEPQ